MKHRTASLICVMATLAIGSIARSAEAGEDQNKKLSVTVAFGAGLNTAPTSPANHHVLPKTIDVKTGGVVNFAVAGFHQIFVYKPGIEPEDIVVPPFPVAGAPPRTNLFINHDLANLYYLGINPAGGPPPATAATSEPSNASNRIESVVFSEPGTYLVICNVTPHFRNGMFAFVRVTGGDD
jgi:plastocyanin